MAGNYECFPGMLIADDNEFSLVRIKLTSLLSGVRTKVIPIVLKHSLIIMGLGFKYISWSTFTNFLPHL